MKRVWNAFGPSVSDSDINGVAINASLARKSVVKYAPRTASKIISGKQMGPFDCPNRTKTRKLCLTGAPGAPLLIKRQVAQPRPFDATTNFLPARTRFYYPLVVWIFPNTER